MMQLRDYQKRAIDAVYDYWISGKGDNPLIVAATGAGKSLIIAKLCQDACVDYPDTRILIVSHVKELLEQNADELRGIWAQADIGIYSAGANKRDLHNQIIFAGVQSFYDKAHKGDKFDIVLVDEAHTISRTASTRYGQLFTTLKLMNPKLKIVGLTATPYRLDSGYLHEGKVALFDGIAYDISVADLIEQGYLTPVISKGGVKDIDLSKVGKRGGEYIESDLAKAASDPDLVREVVAEVVEYGKSRKSWLVFASGVAHAQLLANEFATHGIIAEVLTGETPKKERDSMIERHKSGELLCLINCGVLTTGYNNKRVDLIAMVRATLSTSLYVQIVGRGTRLFQSKENCLFLDYGQNVLEHGTIDRVRVKTKKGGGDGQAPAKQCPNCNTVVHAAVSECYECGHVFPPPQLNHDTRAYSGAMLESQIEPTIVAIDRVSYSRHKKQGAPDSVRITYWSGLSIYQEWFCFDHTGYARDKAIAESAKLGLKCTTTDEALGQCDNWKKPIEITVKPDGKFTKIVSKRYE